MKNEIPRFQNLCELVQYRAEQTPKAAVYSFLKAENQTETITCEEVNIRAKSIGAKLQSMRVDKKTVLLLFTPGLEYISAFMACQFAGAIAVPAYAPANESGWERLYSIIENAGIKIVLSTSKIIKKVEDLLQFLPESMALHLVATDQIGNDMAATWKMPLLKPSDLSFLQFTSGSTGKPKGVMITHGNVLHNSELIRVCFHHDSTSQGVIWLPPYHDMGLIGGILQPMYVGFPVLLMSPYYFVQEPLRWLKAISDYKATTSGGPNFAFDLCVKKIQIEDCQNLNLSSWKIAFNGGEPVRANTIDRFEEKFKTIGFRRTSFLPCYGLAESTLIVSGCNFSDSPKVFSVKQANLSEGNIALKHSNDEDITFDIVSAGPVVAGIDLLIIDPDTNKICPDGCIGEICIKGESVTRGYWPSTHDNNGELCQNTTEVLGKTFFRTGDLGALFQNELLVTGRLKDLLIVNGKNLYPQDIEASAESVHEGIRANCSAAFSIGLQDEQLYLVVEINSWVKTETLKEIKNEIAKKLLSEFG